MHRFLSVCLWEKFRLEKSHISKSGTENVLNPEKPENLYKIKKPPLREGPNETQAWLLTLIFYLHVTRWLHCFWTRPTGTAIWLFHGTICLFWLLRTIWICFQTMFLYMCCKLYSYYGECRTVHEHGGHVLFKATIVGHSSVIIWKARFYCGIIKKSCPIADAFSTSEHVGDATKLWYFLVSLVGWVKQSKPPFPHDDLNCNTWPCI